jgi:hypothetical protein
MSSITEIKQKATKRVIILKKQIEIFKRMIKLIQEGQEHLENCAAEGYYNDGEYLERCNSNMIDLKNCKKKLFEAEEQLITDCYLKKHGHYPKIEFSDSDSDSD